LAGFQAVEADLRALGIAVVAASVDPLDKATEVAAELSFPIGYGVTREMARMLGSWWEERRSIIQPSGFIVDAGGTIVASSYSDGPLGRFDAADVLRWVRFRDAQAKA
jgi:peroxiredoxin